MISCAVAEHQLTLRTNYFSSCSGSTSTLPEHLRYQHKTTKNKRLGYYHTVHSLRYDVVTCEIKLIQKSFQSSLKSY